MKVKNTVYLTGLGLLLILVFIIAFGVGKYPVTLEELIHIIWGRLSGSAGDWSNKAELVLFNIRLPRLLAAAMIGAGLSGAGAAYQGVFSNPMVSPDLLGASSGAGFGAALALFGGMGYMAVTACSFGWGIGAVLLTYLAGTRVRHNQMLGMVLAGIMISSLFSAAISFIKMVADPGNVLPAITYWLMGSISNMTMQKLGFAVVPVIVGVVILFLVRWRINLLTMGDEEACSMGVNARAIRAVTIVAATLITAACVSISGLIGWIGLVIPHLVRLAVGNNYKTLLPASMLLGASFLIVVDALSRSMASTEIPIGILTAFVGAPFFLYLILTKGTNI